MDRGRTEEGEGEGKSDIGEGLREAAKGRGKGDKGAKGNIHVPVC